MPKSRGRKPVLLNCVSVASGLRLDYSSSYRSTRGERTKEFTRTKRGSAPKKVRDNKQIIGNFGSIAQFTLGQLLDAGMWLRSNRSEKVAMKQLLLKTSSHTA